MRYVYGITGAILLGGAAATLSLSPLGAQTAQNEPGTIQAAPPPGAPTSFAALAERLQPAVVNISTRQVVQVRRQQLPPGFEDFFRRFGGQAPDSGGGNGGNGGANGGGDTITQRGGSLGSGFIISPDGYVVTNNHVVAPAAANAVVEQITVTLADRTEYEAEVVGRDATSDIALLKINPTRRCRSCASAIRPRPGSVTGWSRSAIRSGSAARSPPASSRRFTATSTPASTIATSRPTRRSIQAIPAARCSTFKGM